MQRTLIIVALVFLPTTTNAATKQHATNYCFFDPWDDQGHVGFTMKARLILSGSHYALHVWNNMPDNSQTLEIDADGTYNRRGPTHIRFIDNYGNHGRGTFTANKSKMRIEVDRVRATEIGRNIGRNYGTYELKSRGCQWQQG